MAQSVKTFSDINITPLTDIFLVLLIIMMVVAPMLQTNGIKLATPVVESSPDVKTEPKTMTVFVGEDGKVQLDKKEIAWDRLVSELSVLKATKPDGVLIEVQGKVPHELLAKALDSANLAGIDKVGVMVAPDTAESAVAPRQSW